MYLSLLFVFFSKHLSFTFYLTSDFCLSFHQILNHSPSISFSFSPLSFTRQCDLSFSLSFCSRLFVCLPLYFASPFTYLTLPLFCIAFLHHLPLHLGVYSVSSSHCYCLSSSVFVFLLLSIPHFLVKISLFLCLFLLHIPSHLFSLFLSIPIFSALYFCHLLYLFFSFPLFIAASFNLPFLCFLIFFCFLLSLSLSLSLSHSNSI